ncbi:MAG: VIT1/CCC1 transporter family protein [Candidatus Micrarchaeia archaeon]|jgi:predicted membrane protein (TIGR00267 family)
MAKSSGASILREIILGGQDGLVNVLGLVLGMASATNNAHLVIVAGLAATFAESFSMAGVAYTASKASRDYYLSQKKGEQSHEISWASDLQKERHPIHSSVIVCTSCIIGSLIPLSPFFILPVQQAIFASLALSLATLFSVGALKAKWTVGKWHRSGLEMAAIGIGAALIGYAIGTLLGVREV